MPLAANSDTSGISRTLSAGTPTSDCHDGLAYPAQVPLTTPLVVAAPVAQPLGPPLPEAVVCNPSLVAVVLLQKPEDPYVTSEELPVTNVAISALAQESFHGISGIYDSAEPKVVPFVEPQYVLFVPAKESPKSVPPTDTL